MAYTESLWKEEQALQNKNHIISGSNGTSIATVYENRPWHEAKENAKRIVACVNACAGIRTEAIESGLIKHLLNDAYMRTLNPFDPNPQNKMDMEYMGKPVYEEDFEEVENEDDKRA